MLRTILPCVLTIIVLCGTAKAQIAPPSTQVGGNQVATLKEILVNNLRATLPEQQQFLDAVVTKTNEGKLEKGLVFAVMRYSQRKNERFPFPFFERAMRHQATKRGVTLPSVAVIVTSKSKR